MLDRQNFATQERQPVLNLPPVIVACLVILVGIHLARVLLLSGDADFDLLLRFAFIPLRVIEPAAIGGAVPGGEAAAIWSFVTYGFFHVDWTHLVFNGLWLTAFGAPLAWRFGTGRFAAFAILGTVAGAVAHLAFNYDDIQPMIGASAAVSAMMAGASRFVFSTAGAFGGAANPVVYRQPAAPLSDALRDRRVLAFLGVWFGLNLLFGLLGPTAGLASGAIAWEAHIGGFIAGLLAFPLFDPVARRL